MWTLVLSASIMGKCSSPQSSFWASSGSSLEQGHVPLILGTLTWAQYSRWGFTRGGWKIASFNPLAILLMNPKVPLYFWAVSTHCRLISSFSSTSPAGSFSTGLLSVGWSPSLCPCLGLTQAEEFALGLVKFHETHMGAALSIIA